MNREQELAAARDLKANGWIVSKPTPEQPTWFVGLGSHGGQAPSLRKAVKSCLGCCRIWKYWTLPNGQPALTHARQICENYFGGWK